MQLPPVAVRKKNKFPLILKSPKKYYREKKIKKNPGKHNRKREKAVSK